MLLPHESTIPSAPLNAENALQISPDEAPVGIIPLENAKNDRKVDEQLKLSTKESNIKRVNLYLDFFYFFSYCRYGED